MYACTQTYFDPPSCCVYTSHNFVARLFFPKNKVSHLLIHALILVKLICPNNIHTTDKTQKLIFHSMLSKLKYVGVLLMANLFLYGVLTAYKVGTLTIL
jgi:hypothetical protein